MPLRVAFRLEHEGLKGFIPWLVYLGLFFGIAALIAGVGASARPKSPSAGQGKGKATAGMVSGVLGLLGGLFLCLNEL